MITDGPRHPDPSLSAELAQVEKDCPHWHAYSTKSGWCWAVTSDTPWPDHGVTVDARTPQLLLHEIAKELERWRQEGWAA